jgi:O-antigen ligase
VAGAVIGLSVSRVGLVLVLGVVAVTVLAPRYAVGASRGRALMGVVLVALSAAMVPAVLGGEVAPGSVPGGWRLAVVVSVCACAPLVWIALEAGARRSSRAVLALAAAAVLAAVAVTPPAGSAAAAAPPGSRVARADPSDVLHGRGNIWRAGARAFARRPLQGYGAAGFGAATLDLQDPVITSYAHDMPLELAVELGVLGLALAAAIYALVARAWWRVRGVAETWVLAVPALAFLLANLVDWPWHIAGMGAVWAAASAALIASDRVPSRAPSPGLPSERH